MSEFCLIITSTNDKNIAKKIITELLLIKLSVCSQISEVESHFIWKDNIEMEKEYKILIKAKSSDYNKIENIIKLHHNYEMPEIIKCNIDGGSSDYLQWLRI
jgi:periplasmic divalent cation tolerance protein